MVRPKEAKTAPRNRRSKGQDDASDDDDDSVARKKKSVSDKKSKEAKEDSTREEKRVRESDTEDTKEADTEKSGTKRKSKKSTKTSKNSDAKDSDATEDKEAKEGDKDTQDKDTEGTEKETKSVAKSKGRKRKAVSDKDKDATDKGKDATDKGKEDAVDKDPKEATKEDKGKDKDAKESSKSKAKSYFKDMTCIKTVRPYMSHHTQLVKAGKLKSTKRITKGEAAKAREEDPDTEVRATPKDLPSTARKRRMLFYQKHEDMAVLPQAVANRIFDKALEDVDHRHKNEGLMVEGRAAKKARHAFRYFLEALIQRYLTGVRTQLSTDGTYNPYVPTPAPAPPGKEVLTKRVADYYEDELRDNEKRSKKARKRFARLPAVNLLHGRLRGKETHAAAALEQERLFASSFLEGRHVPMSQDVDELVINIDRAAQAKSKENEERQQGRSRSKSSSKSSKRKRSSK